MESTWLNLDGKTAIITGGASGIGKAVAQEFLNNGANVVVCDMNPDRPEFDEENGNVEYIVTNVASKQSVEKMIEKTKARFGKIDIIVNNAGINVPRLLVDSKEANGKFELDEGVWDKVMNVNVKGVFFCSQVVAREMVKQGGGVIINMSSESGLEGSERAECLCSK